MELQLLPQLQLLFFFHWGLFMDSALITPAAAMTVLHAIALVDMKRSIWGGYGVKFLLQYAMWFELSAMWAEMETDQ